MNIYVNAQISLSKLASSDATALAHYLNDEDIYKNTLRVPYPYRLKHAKAFLKDVQKSARETGRQSNWAIRKAGEGLIGGIGLQNKYGTKDSHKDEIGYWLARPFWNQGIMSQVVDAFAAHCLQHHGFSRLEATVFDFNISSCKVLEKAGFEKEGLLKKYCCKNGQYYNCWLYARITPD